MEKDRIKELLTMIAPENQERAVVLFQELGEKFFEAGQKQRQGEIDKLTREYYNKWD